MSLEPISLLAVLVSITIPAVKRRLLNLLAGVSLFTLVVTAGVWETSYYVNFTRVSRSNPKAPNTETIAGVWAGGFGIWTVGCSHEPIYNTVYAPCKWTFYKVHDPGWLTRPWLRPRPFIWFGCVNIPFWLPMILFSLIPAFRLAQFMGIKWRHQMIRRINPGLCQFCGYDLRATLDRCPECGKIPIADRPT